MNAADITPAIVRRFEAKYQINPDTGCWDWLAGRDSCQYGVFWFGDGMAKAHRFSYLLHHGEIDGGFVCHHCDNPTCVNPEHLYLGDCQSNNADRVRRGRNKGCEKKAPPRVIGFGIPPLIIAEDRGKAAEYCKMCGHHRIDDLPRSGNTPPRCRNCKRRHVRNTHKNRRDLRKQGETA